MWSGTVRATPLLVGTSPSTCPVGDSATGTNHEPCAHGYSAAFRPLVLAENGLFGYGLSWRRAGSRYAGGADAAAPVARGGGDVAEAGRDRVMGGPGMCTCSTAAVYLAVGLRSRWAHVRVDHTAPDRPLCTRIQRCRMHRKDSRLPGDRSSYAVAGVDRPAGRISHGHRQPATVIRQTRGAHLAATECRGPLGPPVRVVW